MEKVDAEAEEAEVDVGAEVNASEEEVVPTEEGVDEFGIDMTVKPEEKSE